MGVRALGVQLEDHNLRFFFFFFFFFEKRPWVCGDSKILGTHIL